MKKERVDRDLLFAHIRGRCNSFLKAAGYSGSLWWGSGHFFESCVSADKAFLLRVPAIIVSGMLASLPSISPLNQNEYALISAPLATEWAQYIEKLISKEYLVKCGFSEYEHFSKIEGVKYDPTSFIEDTKSFYDIIQHSLGGKKFPSRRMGYTKQGFTTKIVALIAKKLKEKYHWSINVLAASFVPEEYSYIIEKYGKGNSQIAGIMDFSHFQANIPDPFDGYRCYIKRFTRMNTLEITDSNPNDLINSFIRAKEQNTPSMYLPNNYRKIQACISNQDNNETVIAEYSVNPVEESFYDQVHKLKREGRFWDTVAVDNNHEITLDKQAHDDDSSYDFELYDDDSSYDFELFNFDREDDIF